MQYLNQLFPVKRGGNPTSEIVYDSINNLVAYRKSNTSSKLTLNSECKNIILHYKYFFFSFYYLYISFSYNNNIIIILVKDKEFFHPLDRNHQPIHNKLTSIKTSNLLSIYLQSCAKAENMANEMMKELCQKLYQNILTLVQSSHCATIFQCAYEHTESSIHKNWILPSLTKQMKDDRIFKVEGLFPYWMKSSLAVVNDIEINGTILLTAPNMAGNNIIFL